MLETEAGAAPRGREKVLQNLKLDVGFVFVRCVTVNYAEVLFRVGFCVWFVLIFMTFCIQFEPFSRNGKARKLDALACWCICARIITCDNLLWNKRSNEHKKLCVLWQSGGRKARDKAFILTQLNSLFPRLALGIYSSSSFISSLTSGQTFSLPWSGLRDSLIPISSVMWTSECLTEPGKKKCETLAGVFVFVSTFGEDGGEDKDEAFCFRLGPQQQVESQVEFNRNVLG